MRGRILDRFGVELATNRRNYRVLLIKEQASEGVEAALDALGRIIPLTAARHAKRCCAPCTQNRPFVPVTVADNLSWDEFARVNLHLPYLPGIQPDVGETRAYPFGAEMSHILGYVAAVSPEDKKDDDDPLLDLPGFRIGKRGIEKEFDAEIRGSAGTDRVEVNAYGRVIRELSRDPGVPGADVYLTIDRQVQDVLTKKLGEQSAASVVMDVETGDVIALASTPGLRSQSLQCRHHHRSVAGADQQRSQSAAQQGHRRRLSAGFDLQDRDGARRLSRPASPRPISVVNCTGVMRLGDHEFHCWKHHGRMAA